MKRHKKHDLILVSLNRKQIEAAQRANGTRGKITHALLCGPYGQMFGTEEFCRKYYSVWVENFPLLFGKRKKVKRARISDYEHTPELVTDLFEAQDAIATRYGIRLGPPKHRKRSGCLTSLISFLAV